MHKFYLCLLVSVAAVAVLSVFSGCASSAVSGDKAKPANFTLSIEENPTTGFTWQYEIADEDKDFVELQGSSYEPKKTDSRIVGSGGNRIFVFLCKKTGNCKITFMYKRSWEKGTADVTKILSVAYDGKSEPVYNFVSE